MRLQTLRKLTHIDRNGQDKEKKELADQWKPTNSGGIKLVILFNMFFCYYEYIKY